MKDILFAFWDKKVGYFEGWGQVQIVFWSTHMVQQLLSSLFPSILTFDFDLFSGPFLTIWDKKPPQKPQNDPIKAKIKKSENKKSYEMKVICLYE